MLVHTMSGLIVACTPRKSHIFFNRLHGWVVASVQDVVTTGLAFIVNEERWREHLEDGACVACSTKDIKHVLPTLQCTAAVCTKSIEEGGTRHYAVSSLLSFVLARSIHICVPGSLSDIQASVMLLTKPA